MMEQPWWFRRALAAPSQTGRAEVAGAHIHYEAWGQPGPGVALIHGSNAHVEWWRFVAPFLAEQGCRVAAFDLSGNGDSDWRERYSGEVYAEETLAICEAAGLGSRPIVAGHSFGGFVALEAAHRYGAELGGAIFVDFTVAHPSVYVEWGARAAKEGKQPRATRVYPELETALKRFRFVPEQPGTHAAVIDHVARRSLRRVEGGWTWKFDPTVYDHLEMGRDQRDKFIGLQCRSAVIVAEHSDDEGARFGDHMLEITGGKLPLLTLPGVHHHMMFETPVALALALAGLARAWAAEDGREEMAAALAQAAAPRPAAPPA